MRPWTRSSHPPRLLTGQIYPHPSLAMEEYRTAHTVLLHRWARRFRTVPSWPVRSPVLPSPFGRFHAAASIACLLAFSAQLRPHPACKILNLFIVVYFELFARYPLCRSRVSCRECSHRKMSEVWIPACAGMTEQFDKNYCARVTFAKRRGCHPGAGRGPDR